MRMQLLSIAVGIIIISFIWGVYWGMAMKSFLRSTPSIHTTYELDEFKRMVASQMYATLVFIGLTGTAIIVLGTGLFKGIIYLKDIQIVLLCYIPIGIAGAYIKSIEKKIHLLPVGDSEIERERNRIIEVWNKKALPDW